MDREGTAGPRVERHRRRRVWARGPVLRITLALSLAGGAAAGAAELPQYGESAHIGVGECAGGPCHGSASPVGKRVNQNEHTIWIRHDRHSGAYKTLLSNHSKSIARNLGLQDPQHSPECLDCHSDNAEARDTKTHSLEEGVGCEACHGGGKNWLQSHDDLPRTHDRNLADGMYPTDQPLARAELCISCHFGNERKFVDHRMMGAGHPRLRFELDTFGLYQPPHFDIDRDYVDRGKVVTESAKLWAIGQAVLARNLLSVIADTQRNRKGIWPEFAVLDCYSCHHAMGKYRRPARGSTGLRTHPGTPRLNDSSLLMLQSVLKGVAPESAQQLRSQTTALHKAMSRSIGDRAAIAQRLASVVEDAIPKLQEWNVSLESVRTIVLSLIDEGIGGEFRDFPSAEQAMQAIQSLADTLEQLKPLDNARRQRLQQAIKELHATTLKPDRFSSPDFVAALKQLRQPLGDL